MLGFTLDVVNTELVTVVAALMMLEEVSVVSETVMLYSDPLPTQ